jgi:hypothetical protein
MGNHLPEHVYQVKRQKNVLYRKANRPCGCYVPQSDLAEGFRSMSDAIVSRYPGIAFQDRFFLFPRFFHHHSFRLSVSAILQQALLQNKLTIMA